MFKAKQTRILEFASSLGHLRQFPNKKIGISNCFSGHLDVIPLQKTQYIFLKKPITRSLFVVERIQRRNFSKISKLLHENFWLFQGFVLF